MAKWFDYSDFRQFQFQYMTTYRSMIWFSALIVVDTFLVLSGILTSMSMLTILKRYVRFQKYSKSISLESVLSISEMRNWTFYHCTCFAIYAWRRWWAFMFLYRYPCIDFWEMAPSGQFQLIFLMIIANCSGGQLFCTSKTTLILVKSVCQTHGIFILYY